MNMSIQGNHASTSRPLAGKFALVAGSTSGIGLGIAMALAEAGAAVVLNGFGNAADIDRTRHCLAGRWRPGRRIDRSPPR